MVIHVCNSQPPEETIDDPFAVIAVGRKIRTGERR